MLNKNGIGGSDGKESACNVGDMGLNPGLGRYPGEENSYSLQYCCLQNSWTEEPGRLQSMGLQRETRLSNFHISQTKNSYRHIEPLENLIQEMLPSV